MTSPPPPLAVVVSNPLLQLTQAPAPPPLAAPSPPPPSSPPPAAPPTPTSLTWLYVLVALVGLLLIALLANHIHRAAKRWREAVAPHHDDDDDDLEAARRRRRAETLYDCGPAATAGGARTCGSQLVEKMHALRDPDDVWGLVSDLQNVASTRPMDGENGVFWSPNKATSTPLGHVPQYLVPLVSPIVFGSRNSAPTLSARQSAVLTRTPSEIARLPKSAFAEWEEWSPGEEEAENVNANTLATGARGPRSCHATKKPPPGPTPRSPRSGGTHREAPAGGTVPVLPRCEVATDAKTAQHREAPVRAKPILTTKVKAHDPPPPPPDVLLQQGLQPMRKAPARPDEPNDASGASGAAGSWGKVRAVGRFLTRSLSMGRLATAAGATAPSSPRSEASENASTRWSRATGTVRAGLAFRKAGTGALGRQRGSADVDDEEKGRPPSESSSRWGKLQGTIRVVSSIRAAVAATEEDAPPTASVSERLALRRERRRLSREASTGNFGDTPPGRSLLRQATAGVIGMCARSGFDDAAEPRAARTLRRQATAANALVARPTALEQPGTHEPQKPTARRLQRQATAAARLVAEPAEASAESDRAGTSRRWSQARTFSREGTTKRLVRQNTAGAAGRRKSSLRAENEEEPEREDPARGGRRPSLQSTMGATTSRRSSSVLPIGWRSAVDSKGRTYYYNREAGLTQWQPPEPGDEVGPEEQAGGTRRRLTRSATSGACCRAQAPSVKASGGAPSRRCSLRWAPDTVDHSRASSARVSETESEGSGVGESASQWTAQANAALIGSRQEPPMMRKLKEESFRESKADFAVSRFWGGASRSSDIGCRRSSIDEEQDDESCILD